MDCHDTILLLGSRLVHSLLDFYCSFEFWIKKIKKKKKEEERKKRRKEKDKKEERNERKKKETKGKIERKRALPATWTQLMMTRMMMMMVMVKMIVSCSIVRHDLSTVVMTMLSELWYLMVEPSQ